MELETYLYRNRQSTESDRSGPARVVVFIPALNEEDKIAEVITTINERYRDSAPAGFTVETVESSVGRSSLPSTLTTLSLPLRMVPNSALAWSREPGYARTKPSASSLSTRALATSWWSSADRQLVSKNTGSVGA